MSAQEEGALQEWKRPACVDLTIMHNVYVNTILKASEKATHIDIDETSEWIRDGAAITFDPSRRLEIRDLQRAMEQIPVDQLQVVLLVGLERM